jgi:hypothetical protein
MAMAMNRIKAESFVANAIALITESANGPLSGFKTWESAQYVVMVNVIKNVGRPRWLERADHFVAVHRWK